LTYVYEAYIFIVTIHKCNYDIRKMGLGTSDQKNLCCLAKTDGFLYSHNACSVPHLLFTLHTGLQ